MSTFDPDAALERVRAARAELDGAPGAGTDAEHPPELSTTDLGARMHGKPYDGDPLAAITDRMFRH